MLTTESAISIVNDFISKLQAEGIEIQKAVLFGSFAVNCQNEWSDIDPALVSDSFTGFGFEDKRSFAKINCQKPIRSSTPKLFLPFILIRAIRLLIKLRKWALYSFKKNDKVSLSRTFSSHSEGSM